MASWVVFFTQMDYHSIFKTSFILRVILNAPTNLLSTPIFLGVKSKLKCAFRITLIFLLGFEEFPSFVWKNPLKTLRWCWWCLQKARKMAKNFEDCMTITFSFNNQKSHDGFSPSFDTSVQENRDGPGFSNFLFVVLSNHIKIILYLHSHREVVILHGVRKYKHRQWKSFIFQCPISTRQSLHLSPCLDFGSSRLSFQHLVYPKTLSSSSIWDFRAQINFAFHIKKNIRTITITKKKNWVSLSWKIRALQLGGGKHIWNCQRKRKGCFPSNVNQNQIWSTVIISFTHNQTFRS